MNWRNRRLLDQFGIQHPVLLAPMAGATNADMVVRVSNAGGMGGLGAAGLLLVSLGVTLLRGRRARARRARTATRSRCH